MELRKKGKIVFNKESDNSTIFDSTVAEFTKMLHSYHELILPYFDRVDILNLKYSIKFKVTGENNDE